MPELRPERTLVERFSADCAALAGPGARIGLAVSGGPDSLALLLLASAAFPGQVAAATVDHGLRPESAAEAAMVARLCDRLGIAHAVLAAGPAPRSSLQAWAREQRYEALAQWALDEGLGALATGHHRDDQAETFLMRLARGSGVGGLGAIRRSRRLGDALLLIRPLLGWTRAELAAIVANAGVDAVDDPSNRDPAFDRSRVRAFLRGNDVFDPERIAASASHCAQSDEALDWAASAIFDERCSAAGRTLRIDCSGLPREIRRRLLLRAIDRLGGPVPAGPSLAAALDRLEAGETMTLSGLKLGGGKAWTLSPAPGRRNG